MDYNYLAELLFPDVTATPDDMKKKYPPRNLPEGAKVTRFAPSPTGFIHLGNLYGVMTDERLAHQSGGVMFLRIEDTDKKREVKNGVAIIINLLSQFGLRFDEGATIEGDNGVYGPYRQSQRVPIYHVYAKQLVKEGKAYPCFCTTEELKSIRDEQKALKVTPGYYGKWAFWRDAGIDKIKAALDSKQPYVLRYRSEGKEGNTFKFTDLVKGVIDVSENFIDHVILKSDGVPDYHFAHAVDDHLMHTTHVVRDESWLPSLPFHIQLFKSLGFAMPKYIHTAQVMKLDNGKKRKLSKRKDPEFGMSYFYSAGYPIPAASEYLLTLLNSNFEEWRTANPDRPYIDFPFSVKKMSASGCLFDFVKLNDISKNVVSRMSAEDVFRQSLAWAREYDKPFAAQLSADENYAKSIISIGRGGKKPRKDYGTWVELKNYMQLFYDETFTIIDAYPEGTDLPNVNYTISTFLHTYNPNDDQETWFNKIKLIASKLNYAVDMKDYKANPLNYYGSIADISMFLRVAITGKLNSPDMYTVMQILGKDRIRTRIKLMVDKISNSNL